MYVLRAVCDIRAVLVKVVNMGVISLGVAMFDTVVSLIKLLLNRIIHLTRLVYFNLLIFSGQYFVTSKLLTSRKV